MRSGTLLVLCALSLLAAPARAQDPAQMENPPAVEPPAIPWAQWLQQLEAQGAVIGKIHIRPQNIFDLADPHENYLLYRLANFLHVVTRPEVVEKTLLFKSGDKLSVRVIEETERLLRSTLQVYAAYIRPISVDNGVVELEVVTRDRWTLDPSISFSRTGGVNSDRLALKEDNLLGTGTSIGYSRSSNVDRTTSTFNISHPHALGPFTSANYSYADASDGKTWAFGVNRPFFALDSRESAGLAVDSSSREEPVYVSGMNTGTYRHDQNNATFFFGRSTGLVDGWTRRHTLGYQYQDNSYARIPGEAPMSDLPEDLTLSAPYYRFEIVQDGFRTGTNFEQIGKPEDFNVGLAGSVQVGRSISWLGSSRQQWIYALSLSKGYDVTARSLLRMNGSIQGRYASGGQNQLTNLAAQYYHRQKYGLTFYAGFTGAMVRNPDVPNSLTLGGDNDLRGYPLRYQSGDKSVLVTLEERLYTDWYPFRLVRVGAAVFYDGGRAWGGSNPNTANSGWLSDVGFGLRFLTDRSARSNVLHLDVAFPLNRAEGIDAVQFLVYTKVTL